MPLNLTLQPNFFVCLEVVSMCVLVLRYEDMGPGLGDFMAMSDLAVNPSEKQKLTSQTNGHSPNNNGSINAEGEKKLEGSTSSTDEDEDDMIYCHEDDLNLIGRNRKSKVYKAAKTST